MGTITGRNTALARASGLFHRCEAVPERSFLNRFEPSATDPQSTTRLVWLDAERWASTSPASKGQDTTTVQTHEPLMEKRRIQALVKECSAGLFELACQVSAYRDWDLNLPVGVIDARHDKANLIVTSVGTINSVLRSSSTIGNPLMKRFFERFSHVGLEQARQEFSHGDQAEAFAELWETYLEERRSGGQPMWSVEDSTAFVMHSRCSHRDREVACVAVLCGDPHAIVTFSVPIRFLTSAAEDDGSAGSTV